MNIKLKWFLIGWFGYGVGLIIGLRSGALVIRDGFPALK